MRPRRLPFLKSAIRPRAFPDVALDCSSFEAAGVCRALLERRPVVLCGVVWCGEVRYDTVCCGDMSCGVVVCLVVVQYNDVVRSAAEP